MIYIKNDALRKIKDWSDDSIHVLTDFDRTLTVGNSDSSWGVLSKSKLVPKEYVFERQELYNYYRPIETNESLEFDKKNILMTEWWNKHINLFVKYKISEAVIYEAANNLRAMSFRKGAEEFLRNMKDRSIPIIIISAGIGNFVEQFLINNECDFDNIFIVSNFIKFENEVAVGISENIIHSLNKNEVSLSDDIKTFIRNRPNVILLGDSISDIKMACEKDRLNALKIGFLEEKKDENFKFFEEQFDVVCTDKTSYDELFEKIHILKK